MFSERDGERLELPQGCRLVGMVPSIVIYVVRHGESTGNRDGVLQGQSDYPLTDTGTCRYSSGVTELLCKHHRTMCEHITQSCRGTPQGGNRRSWRGSASARPTSTRPTPATCLGGWVDGWGLCYLDRHAWLYK